MKTIIAIPENKEEWKNWIKENKKKIIGTMGGAALLVTGLALGKTLTDKKDRIDDSETPFLPESEVEPEEEDDGFTDEEPEEETEEEDETDEEGDAE